jgi:hypothetical protein
MAVKRFNIDDLGIVNVYKRRGAKSLKLSVSHSGEIRVVIPSWVPYKAALNFAKSKRGWLSSQQGKIPKLKFTSGLGVGQEHRLIIHEGPYDKIRTQIKNGDAKLFINPNDIDTDEFRSKVYDLCIRVLKLETEKNVFSRLIELAERNDFQYRNLKAKRLKTRWGSCNQSNDITINIFLVQLPEELIDYVLLHELVHTRVLHHKKDFWDELSKYVTDLKIKKREMKKFKPELSLKERANNEYV